MIYSVDLKLYVHCELFNNKMYATTKLENFSLSSQSFKDLKSEKGENVFIDEVALTRSLKVYFKSKSEVVKLVNCLLRVRLFDA